jgi:gas vesicle protein
MDNLWAAKEDNVDKLTSACSLGMLRKEWHDSTVILSNKGEDKMGNNKEITMDNNEKKRNKGGGILIAVAIGAVIGLAVGFLYAPRAGKETRKIFKDKVKITKAKAAEITKKSKGIINDEIKIDNKVGEFIKESRVPVTSSAKSGNGGMGYK